MTLSPSNRKHALCALAALSKYQGRYDQYLQLKQRYSLKWSSTTSVQSLERFFNPDLTFDVMLSKVKEMIQALPEPMALVIKHAVLTGLRPAEAVESVRLLNGDILLSSVRSGGEEDDTNTGNGGRDIFVCGNGEDTVTDFNEAEGDIATPDCENT